MTFRDKVEALRSEIEEWGKLPLVINIGPEDIRAARVAGAALDLLDALTPPKGREGSRPYIAWADNDEPETCEGCSECRYDEHEGLWFCRATQNEVPDEDPLEFVAPDLRGPGCPWEVER